MFTSIYILHSVTGGESGTRSAPCDPTTVHFLPYVPTSHSVFKKSPALYDDDDESIEWLTGMSSPGVTLRMLRREAAESAREMLNAGGLLCRLETSGLPGE